MRRRSYCITVGGCGGVSSKDQWINLSFLCDGHDLYLDLPAIYVPLLNHPHRQIHPDRPRHTHDAAPSPFFVLSFAGTPPPLLVARLATPLRHTQCLTTIVRLKPVCLKQYRLVTTNKDRDESCSGIAIRQSELGAVHLSSRVQSVRFVIANPASIALPILSPP